MKHWTLLGRPLGIGLILLQKTFWGSVLRAVGKNLTVARFLRAANGGSFRYSVAGTIGESAWPAMHTRGVPCGALTQSTGTHYLVAVPYRCGKPIKLKPGLTWIHVVPLDFDTGS